MRACNVAFGTSTLTGVPAGTPVSVEVPHAALAARLSPRDLAALHLRAVQALLAPEGSHVR